MQRGSMVAIGDAELPHAALDYDILPDREDIVPGLQHFANTQRGHDVTGARSGA